MTANAPKDPYNFVLGLMYYLAIGTLLPWNFFINVNGYWMYKFRTVANNSSLTPSATESASSTLFGGTKNSLQIEFTSDLAIAAMIPNVTFLVLNGLFGHRFRTTPRLVWSLALVVLLFTATLVLVKVDTDHWQDGFLVLTLAIVVLINIFTALFQGGLIGLAGAFPSRYMNAVMSGQGIGGVFAAAINIVLLALGGDDVSSAFYCFLLAILFLAGSLVSTIMMVRTDFYRCYIKDPASISNPESAPLLGQTSSQQQTLPEPISLMAVLKAIRVEALTVLSIYIVTLGCFPALTVLVEPTHNTGSVWQTTYFVPTCCFLLYNIGDFIGRFLSCHIPHLPRHLALLASLLRVVFLPLFLFCNLAPSDRQLTPILLKSDLAYCLLMMALAVSNGYLTSVVMVGAPSRVAAHEQQTSTNLMVGILGSGLILGAGLSGAMVHLL